MFYAKTFKIRLSEMFRDSDESLLNDFLESVIPKQIESGLIHHPVEPFWSVLVVYTPQNDVELADGERILFDSYEPLTAEEDVLLMKLQNWRNEEAQRSSLPRHQVLHDAHLLTLVKVRPMKIEDFGKIKGISERKLAKYMDSLLTFFHNECKS